MDGSVAALFEELHPPTSLQSSLDQSAQTSDELKRLLMRTAVDLESTRSQAKLYEKELSRIRRQLENAMQERDEARVEVLRLKESFFSSMSAGWWGPPTSTSIGGTINLQNSSRRNVSVAPAVGDAHDQSCLNIQNSSKASSSPGQPMQLDCISSSVILEAAQTHLSDLHWDVHDLPPPLEYTFPDDQSNNLSPFLCELKPGMVNATFSLQTDRHHVDHPMEEEAAIFTEANELLEKEVQARSEEPDQLISFGIEDHNRTRANDYRMVFQSQVDEQAMDKIGSMLAGRSHRFTSPVKGAIAFPEQSPSETNQLQQLEIDIADLGSSMEAPWKVSGFGKGTHTSNPSTPTQVEGILGDGAAQFSAPRHLPAPPESDPEVMLQSLPEPGKLLQAVMQAGPLLQTLLVAGPLPRWRQPPPTSPVDPMESSLMMHCCSRMSGVPIDSSNLSDPKMPQLAVPSFTLANKGGLSSAGEEARTQKPWPWVSSSAGTNLDMAASTRSEEPSKGRTGNGKGGDPLLGRWMSSTIEGKLDSSNSYTAPMLNTSTNLSYSNRLLRTSALLPKRLSFNKRRPR
ncbi:hypothetical protein KP509_04G037400 [Ceratopteris richardii]|uniref:Uncharacterized protein n=1 Tax=Ceratopteris richardii TaxID=49495 RepID=A0A8T2V3Z6_CERRI|nr:hypothetical protein KP509_04G037400 [Ceratopteris richardii]